jgi:hypothetical protein
MSEMKDIEFLGEVESDEERQQDPQAEASALPESDDEYEEVLVRRKKNVNTKKKVTLKDTEPRHEDKAPTKSTANYKIVKADEEGETVSGSDGELEKPKPKAKQYKKAGENDGRRKRERTPAQKAAWEKALKKRAENRKLRAEEREESKKKKIVKKAVRIKKEQIIDEALEVSDDSSDEDDVEEIQRVKQYVNKKKAKRVAKAKAKANPVTTVSGRQESIQRYDFV